MYLKWKIWKTRNNSKTKIQKKFMYADISWKLEKHKSQVSIPEISRRNLLCRSTSNHLHNHNLTQTDTKMKEFMKVPGILSDFCSLPMLLPPCTPGVDEEVNFGGGGGIGGGAIVLGGIGSIPLVDDCTNLLISFPPTSEVSSNGFASSEPCNIFWKDLA